MDRLLGGEYFRQPAVLGSSWGPTRPQRRLRPGFAGAWLMHHTGKRHLENTDGGIIGSTHSPKSPRTPASTAVIIDTTDHASSPPRPGHRHGTDVKQAY